MSLRVIVIGSGLGGLTLAQSLNNAGIDVAVFERDATPWDRPQGYRLHLDADALNAAREVLSPPLRDAFDATAYRTEPFTTILSTDLQVIKRIPTDAQHDTAAWPDRESPGHANVDRATLRELLLSGLGERVTFGKRLARYRSTPDGVVATFDDGTTADGDVLVGADGIRSAVREQRAPQAGTVDAGLSAIYGRLPMDAARAVVPDATLTDIFTIAMDDRKMSLGLGTVAFPTPPGQVAERFAPGLSLHDRDDYVVAVLTGRHELFSSADELARASSEQLGDIALEMFRSWPEAAREVLRAADRDAFFPVQMYTSVPCELDPPTNVTLLGDAIHAMTPTLGRGANVAMRDGALLGRALRRVAEGTVELPDALADYEHGMLDYGFEVVREAAAVGHERVDQNPLPSPNADQPAQ